VKKNVTIAERNVRTVAGFVMLFYFFMSPVTPFSFALFVLLSLYLLATALVAWDPVYAFIYKVISWLPIRKEYSQPSTGLYA
jgi:hypothetical protein